MGGGRGGGERGAALHGAVGFQSDDVLAGGAALPMHVGIAQAAYDFTVQTRIGEAKAYAYRTRFEEGEHLALVFGELENLEGGVPVRIHREKLVDDVFGPQTPEHEQNLLNASLDRIGELGGGVLIYLRTGFVGVPQESLAQTKEEERRSEWLEVGVGAQILRDLSLSRIRLIAGREVAYVGVSGFGLTLESTEIL